MKKSPLQQVRDAFGTKESLVERLLPVVDRLVEGETDEDFARRLGNASNKQLLRMWKLETSVKDQFGTRDAMIDAIVHAKFGKTNADYRASLARLTKARLLDLHRQIAG